MATKPSTDTTLSVTVLSTVPDTDTPLTTARSPPDRATMTYVATDLPSESTQQSLHRSPSLPSLASTPSSPARSSTLRIDSTTALLPQTSPQSLRTDLPASLPFQTSSQPLRIDLTTSPPRQTRQQLPYLDAASTARYQTSLQHRYIDDAPPTSATDTEEMHSAAACAMSDDFLYCNSVLGPSDKENYSVGSLSRQSDEGHASYMSDSPPL